MREDFSVLCFDAALTLRWEAHLAPIPAAGGEVAAGAALLLVGPAALAVILVGPDQLGLRGLELPREALLASWPLLAMWPVIYGTFQLEKMFVTA